MIGVTPSRQLLLQLLNAGLSSVNGREVVYRSLAGRRTKNSIYLISVGKCALAMAQGAYAALGEQIAASLMVTKNEPFDLSLCDRSEVQCISSSHPIPDKRSLAAGDRVRRFVEQASSDAELLFLISGGASSLVEVLPDEISLQDIVKVNSWLLSNGIDIHQINAIRKRFSLIKGGGILNWLDQRRCTVKLISDVPGDELASIGSGWFFPERSEVDQNKLPSWLNDLLERAAQSKRSVIDNAPTVAIELIASNSVACREIAARARTLGYAVHWTESVIQGDVHEVAGRMAQQLLNGPAGVYIWGGETTVTLPANSGKGGRNQHLAVLLAKAIAGANNITFLAVGSDGNDGPGDDAGGLVDGETCLRAEREGLSVDDYLARADAGSFLAITGDLVHTGPTGTNVMDLMLAVKL